MTEAVRSPREIARDACKEAKRRGIIGDFAVRPGGRATLYRPDNRSKVYTGNVLDTLATLRDWGFRPEVDDQ